jgi:hypothetical protein
MKVLQVQDVPTPNTTDSFRAFQVEQIAADAKETVCRVNDTPFDEVLISFAVAIVAEVEAVWTGELTPLLTNSV